VKHRLRLIFFTEWAKFVLVVVAATGVDWFASTSEHMLEHALGHGFQWNARDPAMLAASVGLLWLAWQAWRHSRRHAGVIVHSGGEARFCPHLVFFLSPPYAGDPPDVEKKSLLETMGKLKLDFSQPDWCPAALGGSPWRMPLAAIGYHARLASLVGRRLEGVHAIASPETSEYAPLFKQVVEAALGQEDLVKTLPQATNFEDFHAVSEAVNEVFGGLERLGEKELLMDITGGSKICSVVAAALTFEQGRRIEFVHGRLGYKVAEYDLRYLAPEFLKPGA
jgi:hypothetical protein